MGGARLVGIVVAALLSASPAAAAPAGYDLFVSSPEDTTFTIGGDLAIPADFFGPGSQPFAGSIAFGSQPLGEFMGHAIGDADTVVQRLEPADVAGPGATDTVPIEIVALSLVSVSPISVQVGSATELWDVSVALSDVRHERGQMTIVRTGDQGGTFSSTLPVIPKLTFTRQEDGATRVLDLGAAQLSEQTLDLLTLRAQDVPWYAGDCPGSILHVEGLNDDFCPSVTEDGEKVLTLEQSLALAHGIYPAQPLQNHYKCYSVRAQTRFRARTVELRDQLGYEQVRVVKPVTLCNPVRKNDEPIQNKRAHLKCYTITTIAQDHSGGGAYVIRDQFGRREIEIGKAERLCLPSTKQIVGKRGQPPLGSGAASLLALGDHYKCYRATGPAASTVVDLRDQFDRERVTVGKLRRLCTPVQKNQTKIQHPLTHLACYQIVAVKGQAPFSPLTVRVRNQFGIELLRVLAPEELCVPATKAKAGDGGGPPPGIPPDHDLTCQPPTLTAQLGTTVEATCRVQAVGGTVGATAQVTLTCQGSAGITCTPVPGSATLAAGGFFDVVVEIYVLQGGAVTVTASSAQGAKTAQIQIQVGPHEGGDGGGMMT